jgi:mRNA-degrading endonuclease toxin of MazEF toxin-antitoxin module
MSKQRGNLSRVHFTKVKKRKGVGSRTIIVPDSNDNDDSPLTMTTEYARVTKTRVTTSGKADGVTTSSFLFSEVETADSHAPLEEDANVPADSVAENIVHVVPAKKKRKKANDTVRPLTLSTFDITKGPLDQDV